MIFIQVWKYLFKFENNIQSCLEIFFQDWKIKHLRFYHFFEKIKDRFLGHFGQFSSNLGKTGSFQKNLYKNLYNPSDILFSKIHQSNCPRRPYSFPEISSRKEFPSVKSSPGNMLMTSLTTSTLDVPNKRGSMSVPNE